MIHRVVIIIITYV